MGKVNDYNDEKNPFIHNSFLSCPSGHAGFSMATFLYLSLLLYEDAFLLFSICNSDVGILETLRISQRNNYYNGKDEQSDYNSLTTIDISMLDRQRKKNIVSSIYSFIPGNLSKYLSIKA